MNPREFIDKWRGVDLSERAAAQSHFIDPCALLRQPNPIAADPKGDWFTFEKGMRKASGGRGWADVWRRGCIASEHMRRGSDLTAACRQLLNYSGVLENPPLLIVSDSDRIGIRTNWTNNVQQVHEIALDHLLDGAKRDLLTAAFPDPERLRPANTRAMLTEKAALKVRRPGAAPARLAGGLVPVRQSGAIQTG